MTRSTTLFRIFGIGLAISVAACMQKPAEPMQAAAPKPGECPTHMVHFATGGVLMEVGDIGAINATTLEAADPDAQVMLIGKTDTVGSNTANMSLSRRRAANVRNALIDNGVLARKIEASYTGELKPVVATADQESELLNRTVVIRVKAKGCNM